MLRTKFHLPALSRVLQWTFLNWEIPVILIAATFLHLVNIDKVIFGDDEAGVFRMAHDAIISGWLPLSSNRASLGNLNPPLLVYLFMLPASLSANPLWGQVMVALINTAAVLLTYFFVRRYYGRLAGTIAALLYTTSAGAWTFSRNIWPQNFLPFFVILFIFVLFLGVIERRKGWLFWAIVLMGVLYQFHGSALFLIIPLLAAVIFAFKTIRLRDIIGGIVALLILFAPYIVWEFHTHFTDVIMIFSATKQPALTNTEALRFYLFFLHPVITSPYINLISQIRDTHTLLPNSHSILAQAHLLTLLKGVYLLSIVLLLGGILLACLQIFLLRSTSTTLSTKNIAVRWWNDLLATPHKQGLALLLLWQVAPLVLLTRHSIVLFDHYFIFLLPGQFILIALCVTHLIALVKRWRPARERSVRMALSTLTALVILAQLVGIGGAIIDITVQGNFQQPVSSSLYDQQTALQRAEQIAQQRHIHRIYITSYPSYIRTTPMEYLAEQSQTPVEVFSSANCFFLPAPSAGPVVFLTTANDTLANALFSQYANATLVATSPDFGWSPYQIYVVTAKPEPAAVPQTFEQSLHLLSPTAQLIQNQWLTTRWSILETHRPAFRSMYGFHFQMNAASGSSLSTSFDCTTTATWAGDQLFAFPTLQSGTAVPLQVTMQAATFVSQPQTLSLGPITGFTYYEEDQNWRTLSTGNSQRTLTLPTTSIHPSN